MSHRRIRHLRASGSGRLLACTLALAGAEVVIALGHVLAGQIADAVLLVLLINAGHRPVGREPGLGRRVAAMRALALVALMRVIGPALPLQDLSTAAGEALMASVIGLAAFRAAPALGVSRRLLYAMPSRLVGVGTAAAGLALGFSAYRLGAPALAAQDDATGRVCLAVSAAVAAALVEEFVFRGLLQVTLQRVAGGRGALAAAGLFACTYLGVGSASLVLIVAVAGLLFAHSVARTGALGGAAAGHVFFACGAFVVWPLLLGPTSGGSPHVALALGAVALLGAVLLARGSVVPVAEPSTAEEAGGPEPVPAAGPPAHAPM